ncbi:MAG: alpha/beta fold hydrolase, partial [Planktomarina sp.]|nr:alpha/beta fold hydrolase [Planktomarina sp.]
MVPIVENIITWLADQEAQIPSLSSQMRKRVLWADRSGQQQDISVVFIHGFSASSEELRPFPDQVAKYLGANLYFTRLTGHGQNSAAMGLARLADWRVDTEEALQVGRRIGRKVVVIACSTGAPLVLRALNESQNQIAACVFVSPNLGLTKRWLNTVLQLPGIRVWGPWVLGSVRQSQPRSAAHNAYWTLTYSIQAVFTMMDAVKDAAKLRFKKFQVPLAVIYCHEDQVVSAQKTHRLLQRWSGPTAQLRLPSGDDPHGHLLVGDLMNPNQTEIAVKFANEFCDKYLG